MFLNNCNNLHYDALRRSRITIFYLEGERPSGDTWRWDGAKWRQIFSDNAPSPRTDPAVAVLGKRLVVFGGSSTSALAAPTRPLPSDETWTWDVADWTRMQPSTVPPARAGAGMAVLGTKVVMFGGWTRAAPSAAGMELNDTWEWDGSDWREVHPASAPPPRAQSLCPWLRLR